MSSAKSSPEFPGKSPLLFLCFTFKGGLNYLGKTWVLRKSPAVPRRPSWPTYNWLEVEGLLYPLNVQILAWVFRAYIFEQIHVVTLPILLKGFRITILDSMKKKLLVTSGLTESWTLAPCLLSCSERANFSWKRAGLAGWKQLKIKKSPGRSWERVGSWWRRASRLGALLVEILQRKWGKTLKTEKQVEFQERAVTSQYWDLWLGLLVEWFKHRLKMESLGLRCAFLS